VCLDEILKVLRSKASSPLSDGNSTGADSNAPTNVQEDNMILKGFDSRYWDGVLPPEYENYFSFYFQKVSQGVGWAPSEGWHQLQLNWKRAKQNYGLPRGPYHYAIMPYHDQDLVQRGALQAQSFYDTIMNYFEGDFGELPPVIDVENVHEWMALEEDMVTFLKALLGETKRLFGQAPMIYTATWFWDQYVAPYTGSWEYWKEYELWEADPPPDTPIAGWTDGGAVVQVALSKSIPGFNDVVDLNETTKEWLDKHIGTSPPPIPSEYNQALDDAIAAIEALRRG